ncbi:MAG: F0F1 ATP synthase subunit gamma, partial [Alphaproteobacteria bacterium]
YRDLQNLKRTPWEGKMMPLITAEKEELFSALLHEYFAIQLIHALIASLAAEHFTRMNHMQQAEKNIEEKLDGLNLEYQQARQNQITEELIDIVSGATAITKKKTLST